MIEVYLKSEDVYCQLQKTIINHLTGVTTYEILPPYAGAFTRTVTREDIELPEGMD